MGNGSCIRLIDRELNQAGRAYLIEYSAKSMAPFYIHEAQQIRLEILYN